MSNSYPRLISWDYYDGKGILSNKSYKESITLIYILNEYGEKEIEDGTLTNLNFATKSINKDSFKIEFIEGYTRDSEKYGNLYKKYKTNFPELEGKISNYKGILKDCGSYVYINIPYLDGFVGAYFYDRNKYRYIRENSSYVKKELFNLDFINDIITYRPTNVNGTVISEYEDKIIPNFLVWLQIKFPELYKELNLKNSESEDSIRNACIGKVTSLDNLNSGKVEYNMYLSTIKEFDFDGEYLKTKVPYKNMIVEIRFKPTEDCKVKIIDPSIVKEDKIKNLFN